jgi:phage shock protein A
MLQSKIQSLENQIAVLTSQRNQLQAADKKQKTTGSILFNNVESATAVINSKLA